MEYDSDSDEYFYLANIRLDYSAPYPRFYIARKDNVGNVIWERVYYADYYRSKYNTFQYSPRYQALYFVTYNPIYLVKVNSLNGDIINLYRITNIYGYGLRYSQCSLSNDELAYF